ncbi:sarcosine oxidase subunit delta [Salinisphaera aquimarina]|uniref:Sarcosine oxidase subunit delta n=1 Tax=Salinisphaera aquimarina TaxID=2094031 RepID=A0ABV7EU63_9GAMM
MLQLECPWCGPRDEEEFAYGGEAHILRPAEPDAVSDETWGDYLFFRSNAKGLQSEQWCHSHGCRRWFNVARDTVTYRVHAVYRIGEPVPQITTQSRS